MTPISQPSGLGALSASMSTKPDMKSEAIQRAQIGLLMGANRNNEPQNKTPKRQTPASATRPKKYALEMWVEIETSASIHTTPEEDSYSVNFAIDCINRTYPGCTGMYLGVVGKRQTLGPVFCSTWRVKCISISEASEILVGCKMIEKESLRQTRWEPQQQFSALQVDSSGGRCKKKDGFLS